MIDINLDNKIQGTILDIGGGGEGIIGRIYQGQVTAIDNRQEELNEAPDGFKKLLMDARDLGFEDFSFENITSFYSLMYMKGDEHNKVIKEAYRVLKEQGNLYIWDSNINHADPFVVNLNINANGEIIKTSYGIYKDEAYQDKDYFKLICGKMGFSLIEEKLYNNQFYLHFKKDKEE